MRILWRLNLASNKIREKKKQSYESLIPVDVYKVCLSLYFFKKYKVTNVILTKPVLKKVLHARWKTSTFAPVTTVSMLFFSRGQAGTVYASIESAGFQDVL